MMKAKFWLVQIAMVAIVSLVFSAPVFATPPDHANTGEAGKGADMRDDKANKDKGNAFFKTGESTEPTGGDEPVCTAWFNGVCVAWE